MKDAVKNTFFGKLGVMMLLSAVTLALGSAVWAGYTEKREQDRGTSIRYKHRQSSYTSPFHYQPDGAVEQAAPAPKAGRCNQFTFDATKSYDEDGQKLTYLWDFGDGTTSDKPVVTKVYDKPGDYRVSLTVRDSSGSICGDGVATHTVSPNFPPVPVAINQEACLGQAMTFDASGSTVSGTPTYKWDFGDGQTAEGVKVTHTYEKPGNYRVILNVNDGKNTECSDASTAITAKVVPSVSVILKSPETSCVGRSAVFQADATGGAGKYRWDFGDGTVTEGGSRMSHAYQKGGQYTVTVTADNGQGFPCSMATDAKKITIFESPNADAGDNLVCCVGKEAIFDASKSSSPTGSKLTYRWDFGDGTSSDQVKTTHVYSKPGNYRVILTVKDDSNSECGMDSDSFVAGVNTQPAAVIDVR